MSKNVEDFPLLKEKCPSHFHRGGGGGLSLTIFEECLPIFLTGKEKQKESINTQKSINLTPKLMS